MNRWANEPMAGFDHLPAVRCSQLWNGFPVSIFSIVMEPGTGQTNQHRLQPTHSTSSTWGILSGGVFPSCPAYESSLAMGVTAMLEHVSACTCSGVAYPSRWMHWCAPSQQAM